MSPNAEVKTGFLPARSSQAHDSSALAYCSGVKVLVSRTPAFNQPSSTTLNLFNVARAHGAAAGQRPGGLRPVARLKKVHYRYKASRDFVSQHGIAQPPVLFLVRSRSPIQSTGSLVTNLGTPTWPRRCVVGSVSSVAADRSEGRGLLRNEERGVVDD
jgi:hypothetical protein